MPADKRIWKWGYALKSSGGSITKGRWYQVSEHEVGIIISIRSNNSGKRDEWRKDLFVIFDEKPENFNPKVLEILYEP